MDKYVRFLERSLLEPDVLVHELVFHAIDVFSINRTGVNCVWFTYSRSLAHMILGAQPLHSNAQYMNQRFSLWTECPIYEFQRLFMEPD